MLGQGGDVITHFEDLEQRSHELSEAEDATTAASRLPSRPPHRARHLQSGQARKLRHDIASFLHRLHHLVRRICSRGVTFQSIGDLESDHRHRSGMHIAGALGQGQWGDDGALQPCGLHLLCLDRLTIIKQLLRRRALKEVRRGAVLSRRCLQRGRRWYDIITVETIDSVVDKICSACTSLQGGVRSRRRVRRRALKEAREEARMRWGATPSTSATSRTGTEQGVYASRLYPT